MTAGIVSLPQLLTIQYLRLSHIPLLSILPLEPTSSILISGSKAIIELAFYICFHFPFKLKVYLPLQTQAFKKVLVNCTLISFKSDK